MFFKLKQQRNKLEQSGTPKYWADICIHVHIQLNHDDSPTWHRIRFQGWFQWFPILSIIYVMRSQWSHQINLICLEHIIAYIEYGHSYIYIHISFRYINVYMYVSLKWLKLLVSLEWELIGCTCGRLRWSQPLLPDSLPRNARWPSPCILVVDTSCELMTA